jgi:zinc and cadmium transporter
MNTFLQAISAGVLAGFASMAIAFFGTARLSQTWLMRLVSFAAGMMLALALIDLLPEAIEGGMGANHMFTVLLITLIALFALDLKLHASCQHGSAGASEHHMVPIVLAGGALHVFTDGLMLGAAFLVDPKLAWGMAVAILAHEVPREVGDFALLLTAKLGRARALAWNALARLACVLGTAAGYLVLSGAREWIPLVLTVAAANFIYIALTGILPRLRLEREAFAWQGGFMVAGAALVPVGMKLLA